MTTAAKRIDVHQSITDRIVAMIEAGASADKFEMPWNRAAALHRPRNISSGKCYRGINILTLWGTADQLAYPSNEWGTYKQWQEREAQVRKGEKGTMIAIFKEYHAKPDGNNPDDDGRRVFASAAYVFNAAQVDGYAAVTTLPNLGPVDRIAAADAFVRGTSATIRHGGQRAYYSPSTDAIQMPDEHLFRDTSKNRTENYYSTLLHELTHWSGAKHRLDRITGARFGDPKYAFEELVAELGAAFLCGTLGIANEPRKDHAQYIANWLAALKHDKKFIFSAASKASAAADYLESLANSQQQKAA